MLKLSKIAKKGVTMTRNEDQNKEIQAESRKIIRAKTWDDLISSKASPKITIAFYKMLTKLVDIKCLEESSNYLQYNNTHNALFIDLSEDIYCLLKETLYEE